MILCSHEEPAAPAKPPPVYTERRTARSEGIRLGLIMPSDDPPPEAA
jgi:hypothetical protein